jgi:hypothetical protein
VDDNECEENGTKHFLDFTVNIITGSLLWYLEYVTFLKDLLLLLVVVVVVISAAAYNFSPAMCSTSPSR